MATNITFIIHRVTVFISARRFAPWKKGHFSQNALYFQFRHIFCSAAISIIEMPNVKYMHATISWVTFLMFWCTRQMLNRVRRYDSRQSRLCLTTFVSSVEVASPTSYCWWDRGDNLAATNKKNQRMCQSDFGLMPHFSCQISVGNSQRRTHLTWDSQINRP